MNLLDFDPSRRIHNNPNLYIGPSTFTLGTTRVLDQSPSDNSRSPQLATCTSAALLAFGSGTDCGGYTPICGDRNTRICTDNIYKNRLSFLRKVSLVDVKFSMWFFDTFISWGVNFFYQPYLLNTLYISNIYMPIQIWKMNNKSVFYSETSWSIERWHAFNIQTI